MKKRFKFLTVILVVALMLSLSVTVAASADEDNPLRLYKDFDYSYGEHHFDDLVYIGYTPSFWGSNATASTAVDVNMASNGLAVVTMTTEGNDKSTSRGTTITSGTWISSGLAGVNVQNDDVWQVYHFATRTFNGTIYSWDIYCS